MPRCPRCRRSFRTLEDEQNDHDCPFCGYDGEDEPLQIRWENYRCSAGARCERENPLICVGYDQKGRIARIADFGITIQVTDNGPTFRHHGCPDLALEAFTKQSFEQTDARFQELMDFVLGPRPEEQKQ